MSMTTPLQQTYLVGDIRCLSNTWGSIKTLRNLPKIGKAFAVPLSFIYSCSTEEELRDAIPTALMMLFEQLEEQDIEELFKTILQDVWVDGDQRLDMDRDIKSPDDLLTLVSKVLDQNYGSLIKGKGFKNLFGVMVPLHQSVM